MTLQLTGGLFKAEAHAKFIKTICLPTDETLGILLLENEFYDEQSGGHGTIPVYKEGYYTYTKRDDKFLSATRYDTLEKASEAFNAIYTMLKSN